MKGQSQGYVDGSHAMYVPQATDHLERPGLVSIHRLPDLIYDPRQHSNRPQQIRDSCSR